MTEARREGSESVSINWAVPAALALLHLILALLAFRQSPFTGGDDAAYISLGQSLLHGRGYTDIWDPAGHPHTQYPPVFAAIVAVGLAAGLGPDVGLKLMMVCFSALAVFASCVFLCRVTTRGVAFWAGFFIAISPEIIRIGQAVLSDVPFWIFSVLALILWLRADVERTAAGSEPGEMKVTDVGAAAAATLAAYFTRTAGLPLLLAVFLWLVLRKQTRALVIMAASALPLILLWAYRSHVEGGSGYLSTLVAVDPYNPSLGTAGLRDLAERIGTNASAYASRHLSWVVFGNPTNGLVFGIPFSLAVLLGWARRIRNPSLSEIWFPLYLGLLLLWPATWSGSRFLLPVIPLIALYVAETVGMIAAMTSFPKVIGATVVVTGALVISTALRQEVRDGHTCRQEYALGNRFPCTDPVFSDFLQTAEASRGKLPRGSVVFSRKPILFFVHSGYASRMYPMYAAPDSLFSASARIGARYLVVDRISELAGRYLQPILLARASNFCIVPGVSTKRATLLRIETDASAPATGGVPNGIRVCDNP